MGTEIGDHAPELFRQESLNPEVLDDIVQGGRRGDQAQIPLSPPVIDPDHLPRISQAATGRREDACARRPSVTLLLSAAAMRGWRAVGAAGAVFVASVVFLALLLDFLAPDLYYQIKDRTAELFSGRGGRKFRIALGSAAGSSYRMGTVLHRYLEANAGYGLEL